MGNIYRLKCLHVQLISSTANGLLFGQ